MKKVNVKIRNSKSLKPHQNKVKGKKNKNKLNWRYKHK